ncbi:hypothetical protein GINT2_000969 [Glugoides intestinalis]
MLFFVYLAFSFIASLFSYVLIKRSKKQVLAITDMKRLKFKLKNICFPNSFQSISIFDTEESKAIQQAFTTITLRTGGDVYNALMTDKNSSFHLNLSLSSKAPCFYVKKKDSTFEHVGMKFCKPFLLNRSKYIVIGNVSEKLHNFLCKFDVEYIYSSYLPVSYSGKDLKTSCVELKAPLEAIDDELLGDFLDIFSTVEHEQEGKYQRVFKEFLLERAHNEAKERLGFFAKLNKQFSQEKALKSKMVKTR